MAVNLFTGDLGGGKTLNGLDLMVSYWRRGGYVITNTAIHWDVVKAECLKRFKVELQDCQLIQWTRDQVREFHLHLRSGTRELPVLVVIDEAGTFWDARLFQSGASLKAQLADTLRQSRKLCTEFVFIVQREDRLDKGFRELMEFRWTFRRFKWIPILSWFILRMKDHAQTDTRISTKWWFMRRWLWRCYDTDQLFSAQAAAELPKLEPLSFKQPFKIPTMMRVCFLVGLCYAAWVLFGVLSKTGTSQMMPAIGKAVAPAPAKPHLGEKPATVKFEPSTGAPFVRPPVPPAAAPASTARLLIEDFRGTDEQTYLRTSSAEYIVGCWSPVGFVRSIKGRAAYCQGLDGSLVIVAVRDSQAKPTTLPPAGQPVASPVLPTVIPTVAQYDHSKDWMLGASDQQKAENLQAIQQARESAAKPAGATPHLKSPRFRGSQPALAQDFATR